MSIDWDTAQTFFTGVTGITKDIGSGIEADAGGQSLIVFDPGTGNRTAIEVTGTYGQGVGESNRFVPPELSLEAKNGALVRIGDRGGNTVTNIKFGLPSTTDGNAAKVDRSNWKRNAAGIVEVPKRGNMFMRYDSGPGGNANANQNFLSGANSVIDLIGMDINFFANQGAGNSSGNNQYNHVHLGGVGNDTDESTLGLYNTTFRFQQASALSSCRVKIYSKNITIEGFTIDFRGVKYGTVAELVSLGVAQATAEAITGQPEISLELVQPAFPTSIKGLEILDDYTTNTGTNSRQVVVLEPEADFSGTFTGVNLRNVCMFLGKATSEVIYVDNVFNTVKAGDSAGNARFGVHNGRRTLVGTILEDGAAITSAPDMVVTQKQSDANQSVYNYDLPNTTVAAGTGQAISADTELSLTNPISNTGVLSTVLDQYRFLHNGSNNDRVVHLRNKYDYAITKFGFVPHRVTDYYHGGRLSAATDEPEYFGMYDTTGRTSYDVTGIDIGTVDMISDVIVGNNTFTSATYTDTYRVTTWDDLYAALHNFSTSTTALGLRGLINVSSVTTSEFTANSDEIELVNGTLTLSGDEVRVGPVAYSASNNKYRVQAAATFATNASGVDSIIKSGDLRLDSLIPNGITFAGTGSGATEVVKITDVSVHTAIPTLAQSAFVNSDFTNARIEVNVPSGTTRYIRFNNCTGSPVIANTGSGTLVVYNPPASSTFTGTVNTRSFIDHVITYGETADVAKIAKVRWANSVSASNLSNPGTFSNTGYTSSVSGNDLTLTFDIPATSAGVVFNLWAGIFYDGYYEEQITASNASSAITAEALTTAELDFSLTNAQLVLTSGTDLLDITVPAIASATADIVATLNDTTGGNLAQGWTNAVARMGMRRGIQESDNYAEALAQGFIDRKWFTWTETATVVAVSGRLNYKHAASNIIFEPAGRIILPNGTDQWRSVSSTAVNERIVFDPDAAGAKGPEIVSLLETSLEDIQGSNTNATLTSIQRKVGGLY